MVYVNFALSLNIKKSNIAYFNADWLNTGMICS